MLWHLPTTCIWMWAVAVEKDGASAVTSHEKFPDNPKPTFRITTWLAFEIDACYIEDRTVYGWELAGSWMMWSVWVRRFGSAIYPNNRKGAIATSRWTSRKWWTEQSEGQEWVSGRERNSNQLMQNTSFWFIAHGNGGLKGIGGDGGIVCVQRNLCVVSNMRTNKQVMGWKPVVGNFVMYYDGKRFRVVNYDLWLVALKPIKPCVSVSGGWVLDSKLTSTWMPGNGNILLAGSSLGEYL